ncbi:bleomycin resistance protein [Haladaptatus sp. R4]|uniref:VOC family protein n=1 Tax=Haladaptatus sp. R4 TaxID=1679489 RepID=UPI0007B49531|nr:VOC family protein [Haladaptatus sp. R4]KZN22464.1 bleomycin resistance protein [Haladaptatus sp. R4]
MSQLSLHHHGVSVTDLDRAVEFYSDVLGFDVIDRYSLSDDALSTAVGGDELTGHFAQLDGGTGRVELIEYEANDGDDGDGENDVRGAAVYDTGAKHLGIETDDLDAVYESLPDDVEAISEPQTTGSGTKILFIRDPDGNPVEILEL